MWPPEDRHGLASVRAAAVTPVAAGENAMSVHDLASMFEAGALDICQPSVIKFGGIAAVAEAVAVAKAHSVDYVPHCFYFGPGYLASLHLAAAFAPDTAFGLFFGDLEASPYHDAVRARSGRLAVPDGPGLGIEPDMDVQTATLGPCALVGPWPGLPMSACANPDRGCLLDVGVMDGVEAAG